MYARQETLQYHVATLIDNDMPNITPDTHRGGRALRTFRERIVGKEGRIRGNLMGKRVDFSARTVITADPNLSIDQVGVPKSIAMDLTVPVTVTEHNMEHLAKCVANATKKHPGGEFLVTVQFSVLSGCLVV